MSDNEVKACVVFYYLLYDGTYKIKRNGKEDLEHMQNMLRSDYVFLCTGHELKQIKNREGLE